MAILLDKIVGHSTVREHFKTQMIHQRMHHAFLFVGPEGVGRKTMAFAIAQALLCRQGPPACGMCPSCFSVENMLFRGLARSESILLIAPEKAQIKIEQAHEVRDFLHLQKIGKCRIVIIDSAEKLNQQAANSLLKLIEEPPDDTTFFMMAPTAQHVLSTIRSRSQSVSFAALTPDQLRIKQPQSSEWALRMAQGSLEKLKEMNEVSTAQAREIALSWIEDWEKVPQAFLLEGYKDYIKDKGQALLLSQLLLGLFRDIYFLILGREEHVFNLDRIQRLKPLAERIPGAQVLYVMKQLVEIENSINSNFDVQLIFEKFWIRTSPQTEIEREWQYVD